MSTPFCGPAVSPFIRGSKKTWQVTLAFLVLMVIAIALRSYGLGSHEVPDESFEVNRALEALQGVFDWERIGKGGLYLLLVPFYYILGFFDPEWGSYLVAGRVVQVALGTAVVWVLYRFIRDTYGTGWAFLFTTPAVFNVQLIDAAHHVNVQNLLYLCVCLHGYFVVRGLKGGNPNLLGWGLVAMFVGAAAQLSAFVLLLPFTAAVLYHYLTSDGVGKKGILKALAGYLPASILLYVLLTPGVVVHFSGAAKGIAGMVLATGDPDPSSYITVKGIDYWSAYARYGANYFGTFSLLLVLASTALVIVTRSVVLFYPVVVFFAYYLICVSMPRTIYAGRYLTPGLLMGFFVMPLAVILFARWAQGRAGRARRFVVPAVVTLLALGFGRSAAYSVQHVRQFALPDTRDAVAAWLERNLGAADRVLLEDSCNYPTLPNRWPTVRVSHWNAYPPLSAVEAEVVVLNMTEMRYLARKASSTSALRFLDEIGQSPQWARIHVEKPLIGKMTGPELHVFGKQEARD